MCVMSECWLKENPCITILQEFRGCVTDYTQCSYQGLTEIEVSNVIQDVHRMVPDPQKSDWDQTKT